MSSLKEKYHKLQQLSWFSGQCEFKSVRVRENSWHIMTEFLGCQ